MNERVAWVLLLLAPANALALHTSIRAPTSRRASLRLSAAETSEYDVVVIADVLYFMSWSKWPPILCHMLPQSFTRPAQRLFFDAISSLATREVIFSDEFSNLGGCAEIGRRKCS